MSSLDVGTAKGGVVPRKWGHHRIFPGLWALCLIAVAAVSGAFAWSAASPVGASPDEPAHISYAWGVATGQVLPLALEEHTNARGKTVAEITVPNKLQQFSKPSCYAGGKPYGRECAVLEPAPGDLEVTSYMAKYPMAYYAIAGSTMRAGLAVGLSGFSTLFLARLVSGVVCYLMIGVGGWMLARRYDGRGVTAVMMLACVPNAHFLFSSINPNGFEIAAAILLAAVVVVLRHDAINLGRVPPLHQVLLLFAVLACGWSRPLGIAWAGLLLLTLLIPVKGRRPTLMYLSAVAQVVLWAAVVLLLAWLVYQATGTNTKSSSGDLAEWESLPPGVQVAAIAVRFGTLITMGFGLLGWADTQIPVAALFVWLLVGTGVLAAFATGSKRADLRPRVAGIVVLGSALVVAVESYLGGFGWQGRYWLPPLAACLVLLAPSLQGRSLSSRRMRSLWWVVVICTVGVGVYSLIYNMWRYRFGFSVPFVRFEAMPYPWQDPVWDPPGGVGLFYVCAAAWVVSSALAVLMLSRIARRPIVDSRDVAGHAQGPDGRSITTPIGTVNDTLSGEILRSVSNGEAVGSSDGLVPGSDPMQGDS